MEYIPQDGQHRMQNTYGMGMLCMGIQPAEHTDPKNSPSLMRLHMSNGRYMQKNCIRMNGIEFMRYRLKGD